jgi:hypothetical protein
MALDAPLASLVISAYAIDEDLVLQLDGATLKPTVERLDARVELTSVPLPAEEAYQAAVGRAAAVFGVSGSPLLSAANVSDLAEKLKDAAEPLREPVQALPDKLVTLADRFEVERGQVRERNAHAGVSLVDGILTANSSRARVEFLAELSLPSSAEHLGASLKQAAKVVTAIEHANLDLLGIAFSVGGDHAAEAGVIRDGLVEAIGRDQFSVDLAGMLSTAVADATKLMAKVTRTDPPAAPPSSSTPVGLPATGTRSVEGTEAAQLLRQLADSGRLRRVEVSWELQE